ADELVDCLEAVVDMAGACSALSALWTKSEMISPDNLLQMTPLLILISMAAGQAVRPSPAGQSP
ncbi:unnamed protein product, partial [Symbiodinium pilosum]